MESPYWLNTLGRHQISVLQQCLAGKGFHGIWPNSVKECNITLKELYVILVAVELFGYVLHNLCAIFHSHNAAVVNLKMLRHQRIKKAMILVRG